MKLLKFIWHIPRNILALLVRAYQKTLSPDHGFLKHLYPHGYCKYTPSCSTYSYEVIKKKGVVVGVAKSAWRVLRCNPWSKGGYDPSEK